MISFIQELNYNKIHLLINTLRVQAVTNTLSVFFNLVESCLSFKLKLTQLHYIFLLYRYKNDKTWADYLYMNVGGKYMKKLSIIIGIIILFTMSNLPM